MIREGRLKDAERIVRLTMMVILLTAGLSKFSSEGGFYNYYSDLFQGELRINLWPWLVNVYLSLVPFIELGLGLLIFFPKLKPWTMYAWCGFMLSLMFGHYVLQEWAAVNQMLDYLFLGLLGLVLPHHREIVRRDP